MFSSSTGPYGWSKSPRPPCCHLLFLCSQEKKANQFPNLLAAWLEQTWNKTILELGKTWAAPAGDKRNIKKNFLIWAEAMTPDPSLSVPNFILRLDKYLMLPCATVCQEQWHTFSSLRSVPLHCPSSLKQLIARPGTFSDMLFQHWAAVKAAVFSPLRSSQFFFQLDLQWFSTRSSYNWRPKFLPRSLISL